MNRVEVSSGAQALLRIAVKSGSHAAVSANYTLFRTLEALNRLHESAKNQVLPEQLTQPQTPRNLLEIVATVSHHIYQEQYRRDSAPESDDRPFLTRFDAHVHQAFAQTLADTIWTERQAGAPPTGPPLTECLRRLSEESRRTLIESFVRNYVGNILQHFFAATEVRRQVRDLPEETETRLRSVEGQALASRVMTLLEGQSPRPAEVSSILGFVITQEGDG